MFIIDGAHNEDGAISLAKSIDKYLQGRNLTLIIGMLEDKDIDSVLDILIPRFNKIITTTPNNPRAINSDALANKVGLYNKEVICKPSIHEAVEYSLENIKDNEVIISAGSLYMIGEVRTLVKINKK